MKIRTVLGDITPEAIGFVLFHEHLCNSMAPWIDDPDLHFTDVALVTEDARLAADDGIALIVDATTADFGRNVGALETIARASGVHVVAGTGLYLDMTYPDSARASSEDALADQMVDDIEHGIDGSSARAGVLGEIGTSADRITDTERKVIRAVAQAHSRTGVAVLTHTAEGRHAIEQLELYLAAGVAPDRIVIGHVDCMPDRALHRAIAELGAFVGFDRIGLLKFGSDEVRADNVVALLESGYEDQLLLSQDIGRLSRLRARGGPGYSGILTRFWPLLRERGVPDAVVEKILVHNSRRLLAFDPRGPER
jgi:phosphotriesterase-related protein